MVMGHEELPLASVRSIDCVVRALAAVPSSTAAKVTDDTDAVTVLPAVLMSAAMEHCRARAIEWMAKPTEPSVATTAAA